MNMRHQIRIVWFTGRLFQVLCHFNNILAIWQQLFDFERQSFIFFITILCTSIRSWSAFPIVCWKTHGYKLCSHTWWHVWMKAKVIQKFLLEKKKFLKWRFSCTLIIRTKHEKNHSSIFLTNTPSPTSPKTPRTFSTTSRPLSSAPNRFFFYASRTDLFLLRRFFSLLSS